MAAANPANRSLASWFRIIPATLLLASGALLAFGGAYLVVLGGSPYYAIAGILTGLSAVLILQRKAEGFWLFGLVCFASIAWSIWEVGFDGWALMPRLVFLLVAFLVLSLTLAGTELRPMSEKWRKGVKVAALALGLTTGLTTWMAIASPRVSQLVPVASSYPGAQPIDLPAREWSAYGGTSHGTRFAPISQINPSNVGQLTEAWTYRPGRTMPGGTRQGGLQMTPLFVGGRVYGCTAFGSIFALNPISGEEIWRFDPAIEHETGGHPVCRGMAYYTAPEGTEDCPERLIHGNFDNKLVAINAQTGEYCSTFGTDGRVDLLSQMGDFPIHWTHPTSPPTLVNDTVVIGGYVVDNQATDVPPGVVRGYSALTGELMWAFDPAKPDDLSLPAEGENFTPSTPNSWAIGSGDPELNLVFVPMGNGSPDFVGGHRTETTKRFSSAVVALDATTGAVRWDFQAIHHDLWDYDLSAQPTLADFPMPNGPVPAVFVPTKTGQVFVLDRRTGEPLAKVEERAVPQSMVPGEQSAATQPFSVGMPDFAGPDLTEQDMWGLTPFDQLYCRIKYRQATYDGKYTPPRLGPTIRYPGELGGIDWGGVSIDESRGIMIVNSNHMADYDELITRAEAEKRGIVARTDASVHSAPGGAMEGTPFAVVWGPFLSGLEVPCQRPPYGFLTAVDLETREVIWRSPIGSARNSGPFGIGLGLPFDLGAPNIGGSMTTAGGLVFIAATQDEMFRAFDVQSGEKLWEQKLPVAGHASPMSYVGPDGRQYVVIAAGGGSLRNASGDYLMAFRLPINGPPS
jgi:quinoprotein glucose dehydrogenase